MVNEEPFRTFQGLFSLEYWVKKYKPINIDGLEVEKNDMEFLRNKIINNYNTHVSGESESYDGTTFYLVSGCNIKLTGNNRKVFTKGPNIPGLILYSETVEGLEKLTKDLSNQLGIRFPYNRYSVTDPVDKIDEMCASIEIGSGLLDLTRELDDSDIGEAPLDIINIPYVED